MEFISAGDDPPTEVLKRRPVSDTDIACPGCGQLAWDRVEVRAEPRDDYYRMSHLECRACGASWGGYRPVGRRRPGRGGPAMPHDLLFPDSGPGGRTIAESVPFAVYVVDPDLAYERSLSRWGRISHENGASQITQVAFLHKVPGGDRAGAITVLSSIDDAQSTDSVDAGTGSELDDAEATSLVEAAVRGVTALLWNKAQLDLDWGVSTEAQDLRRDQMLQEAERHAAQSDTSTVEIPVDGKAVRFVLARDRPGACCAEARVGLVRIQITSEQLLPADLRLLTVSDNAG